MTCREILDHLRSIAVPANLAGMARYGIRTDHALGVPMPAMRALARRVGRDHALAGELWDSGIHEARIMAALVDEPAKVTARQLDAWVKDMDSWDVCDQACNNLFRRTPHAWGKARQWARSRAEFTRRAAFALMASLAVHDKAAGDAEFLALLPLVERAAGDERNFVKKAVNWALRQIGKRNAPLRAAAIACARRIAAQGGKAARWIASDALRELTGRAPRPGRAAGKGATP
jgi:3-methyladenine DNA glycosylase AlkD